MAWTVPIYSKNIFNKSGQIIASPDKYLFEYDDAVSIFENWRASHQYPLNTFQVTLRNKARSVNKNSLVSQRLKRFESISRKLSSGTMQLTQMQDIGGCRAVMPSIKDVYELRNLYTNARFKHVFKNEKDYISKPKIDGYRSIHLIYKYKGDGIHSCYDEMKIEIQIRTQQQHAWATAVEAVGIFTRQALKWRGGSADWQKFFALMSAAIADLEGVENGNINRKKIGEEIRRISEVINAVTVLKAYAMTLNYAGNIERNKAKLLLVHVKPDESKIFVKGFHISDSQAANRAYSEL